MMQAVFLFNSILLGFGLAMDAFSVSLANGIHDPYMGRASKAGIAGTFAGFQFLMPMLGWICVHTIVQYFTAFQKFIPWIALILLLYIGGKMILEAFGEEEAAAQTHRELDFGTLMLQGIATSIDALSVGFTIAEYSWQLAVVCSVLIAITTYFVCRVGLQIGIRFGMGLTKKASLLGGVILILIGLEIFISGMFF